MEGRLSANSGCHNGPGQGFHVTKVQGTFYSRHLSSKQNIAKNTVAQAVKYYYLVLSILLGKLIQAMKSLRYCGYSAS